MKQKIILSGSGRVVPGCLLAERVETRLHVQWMSAEQTLAEGQIRSSERWNFPGQKMRNGCAATRSWQHCQAILPCLHPPKYHIFGVICLPASEKAVASYFNTLLWNFVGYKLIPVPRPPPKKKKKKSKNWWICLKRWAYGSILETGALGIVLSQPCPKPAGVGWWTWGDGRRGDGHTVMMGTGWWVQGQGAAEQELSGGEAASTSPGTAERHTPLCKSPFESNTATIVKGINQEPITKTASHLGCKKE